MYFEFLWWTWHFATWPGFIGCRAVDNTVTMPPVDHAPWPLGQEDNPLSKWLAVKTCNPGVWGSTRALLPCRTWSGIYTVILSGLLLKQHMCSLLSARGCNCPRLLLHLMPLFVKVKLFPVGEPSRHLFDLPVCHPQQSAPHCFSARLSV